MAKSRRFAPSPLSSASTTPPSSGASANRRRCKGRRAAAGDGGPVLALHRREAAEVPAADLQPGFRDDQGAGLSGESRPPAPDCWSLASEEARRGVSTASSKLRWIGRTSASCRSAEPLAPSGRSSWCSATRDRSFFASISTPRCRSCAATWRHSPSSAARRGSASVAPVAGAAGGASTPTDRVLQLDVDAQGRMIAVWTGAAGFGGLTE